MFKAQNAVKSNGFIRLLTKPKNDYKSAHSRDEYFYTETRWLREIIGGISLYNPCGIKQVYDNNKNEILDKII